MKAYDKLIRKGEDKVTFVLRLVTFAQNNIYLKKHYKVLTPEEICTAIIRYKLVDLFDSLKPGFRMTFRHENINELIGQSERSHNK